MHVLRTLPLVALLAAVPLVSVLQPAWSQEKPVKKAAKPIARIAYRTADFRMELRSDTGTLARLSPNAAPAFDFVPGARAAARAEDGYVHLGDLNLRLRTPGGAWQDFASSKKRAPLRKLAARPGTGRPSAASRRRARHRAWNRNQAWRKPAMAPWPLVGCSLAANWPWHLHERSAYLCLTNMEGLR